MNDIDKLHELLHKSFSDVGFAKGMSTLDVLSVLLITFLMGLFIFYVYKKTFQGVLYTQSFNVSLVMIAIVTSLVIMTISSNFILSLGMVGALSIVRFRTAIKDSMDIVFMFWAIAIGIANGAGFFQISLIGTLVIALVLFLLTKLKSNTAPYLLVINYSDTIDAEVVAKIKEEVGEFNLKSKTVRANFVELGVELRIEHENTSFVNTLSQLSGVESAVLVSYNGDYVS